MESARTQPPNPNAHSLANDSPSHHPLIAREQSSNPETISPISISNVLFLEEERLNSSDTSRKYRKATFNSNAANIFRVKGGGVSQRRERMTYIRYENYTSARARKTTEQKIFEINNFVKKLTEKGGFEEEVPEITDTKFKALKKIIEYYDIKNLDRSEYSNVIKSFGLQIGTMKAEHKSTNFSEDKRREIKKMRAMSLLNRTPNNNKIEKTQLIDTSLLERVSQGNNTKEHKQAQTERKPNSREGDPLNLFSSLQVRKQKIKGVNPKRFKFSGGDNAIIEKVNKYRQFLFMLNYSNTLYRPLDIEFYPTPLKFYIGKGNNGNLIRSLMRKRFWFEQTNLEREAHFVWTQIKVTNVFNRQSSGRPVQTDLLISSVRRSPPKLSLSRNDSIARVLVAEEMREMLLVQQSLKKKNMSSFEDRVRLVRRRLKREIVCEEDVVHNHFPGNGLLGNKKALFLCLQEYCRLAELSVFDIVPRTFIISSGINDPEFGRVIEYFNQKKQKKNSPNFWILKPGEFSNRGNGIECTNKLEVIRKRVAQTPGRSPKKSSLIVQEYITRPLLYNGRKFDIRTYMLITNHNGKTKAYWYQDGYVRTSSTFFTLEETDPYIHLTNDAVQLHSDRYGRFEEGNKLSYPELQRYLDSLPALGRNLDLLGALIPKMKDIAGVAVRSSWLSLNKENKDRNFQLFGLDYMVDEDFKPWLIEVNTNPCLQLSSGVLERLIPYMVENALRIGLDTMFPPPDNFGNNHKYNIPENSLHYNKFELIFDSHRDGPAVETLYAQTEFYSNLEGLEEDKNEYKQEGELLNFEDI